MMSNNLGETIRVAREKKGLTHKQLAKLVEVEKEYLKRIEEGKVKQLKLRNLKKLAEYLDLDFKFLLEEYGYIEKNTKQENRFGGQIIREARIAKGLTQYELANLTGIEGEEIRNIESGKVIHPEIENLGKLAQHLEIHFEELLRGYGYPTSAGEMLKRARLVKGMTQKQLSSLSGISPGIISRIENGIGTPQYLTVYLLEKQLDINLEYFYEQQSKKLLIPKSKELPTPIGKVIRDERIEQGLSQQVLSDISGVTIMAISKIERGKVKCLRESTIKLLAKALELDDTELMELNKKIL